MSFCSHPCLRFLNFAGRYPLLSLWTTGSEPERDSLRVSFSVSGSSEPGVSVASGILGSGVGAVVSPESGVGVASALTEGVGLGVSVGVGVGVIISLCTVHISVGAVSVAKYSNVLGQSRFGSLPVSEQTVVFSTVDGAAKMARGRSS